jgi:hypothetical protein
MASRFVALGAAVCAQAQYSLYYTDGGDCNPPWGPTPPPGCEGEIPPLNMKVASFDRGGSLISAANLTSTLTGMGYLSLAPGGKSIAFATEGTSAFSNVETYTLDLTDPTALPVGLLPDISAILAPCATGADKCVEASTFHGTYAPDGKRFFFAYRVWDDEGTGIGNQAIAVSNVDGSNVRPITFTMAGVYAGINIIDTCPSPVPNDPTRLLFVRSLDQGLSNYLAFADLATGNVTFLDNLPQWAQTSGCENPIPTADGLTSLFMACEGSECSFASAADVPITRVTRASGTGVGAAWGAPLHPRSTAVRGGYPNFDVYYGTFSQTLGVDPFTLTITRQFDEILVNTTDYDDTYSVTQCDAIHGTSTSGNVTCMGASMAHDTFQELFVDLSTGNSTQSGNSYNTVVACMTARCTTLLATGQ